MRITSAAATDPIIIIVIIHFILCRVKDVTRSWTILWHKKKSINKSIT